MLLRARPSSDCDGLEPIRLSNIGFRVNLLVALRCRFFTLITSPICPVKVKLPLPGWWVKRSDDDLRDINDLTQRELHRAYPTFHTDSAKEVGKYVTYVKSKLSEILQPLLIVHSTKDKSVSAENADIIYNEVQSEKKEKLIVDQSGHVMTRDLDREEIFERIYQFFNEILEG